MTAIKFHGSHLRNMVLILRDQLYKAQLENELLKSVYSAFCSNEVLRDTVYGRAGNKQADKILLIRQHMADNPLYSQLCAHATTHYDAKTFMSVLSCIKSSFTQFYTNMARYKACPGTYAGVMGNNGAPRTPKAKKINQIHKASIALDSEKWSFKTIKSTKNGMTVTHHYLSVKLSAKAPTLIPVNPGKFPVPAGKVLRSLNINVSNDAVYLNFTYGEFITPDLPVASVETAAPERPQKWAALDVGLRNVLSVFVSDTTTPSLLLCGKPFKHYNIRFNKHISALDEQIAACATEFKTIARKFKDKDGNDVEDKISIATAYSEHGHQLIRTRTHLRECRNRYFDAQFDKLSRRVVDHLTAAGVTDVSLSRNLSFLKTEQDKQKQLNSRLRQQFYHLPFGKLLNHITRKCELAGITVHDIDEAYSSKVSCLSGDVNLAQRTRHTRNKPLSTTDCNGRRVHQGLFRDDGLGLVYHADINGAVNHVKIAAPDYDASFLHQHKPKLCNPLRVKSDQRFMQVLARLEKYQSGAEAKLAA